MGGFERPVPYGTSALHGCTINRSVIHPFESDMNCHDVLRNDARKNQVASGLT